MRKGSELHESFSKKSKRTKIVKDLPKLPREYGVRLYSERYNFNARIDCILFDGSKAYPVEYKFSSKPEIPYNTHKYQAVAQAIVVEEVLKRKVTFCYIKYTDGVLKLPITEELKNRVIKVLKKMDEIVRLEKMPLLVKSKKKCDGCYYKNMCRRI